MSVEKHDYRVVNISKGNGKFRTIYCVNHSFREELRRLLPYLNDCAIQIGVYDYAYAFMHDTNCALHAYQHIDYNYTLSLDMVDFFDHVTIDHVKGLIKDNVIRRCFIDGSPRQGLPTSPLVANIAFNNADHEIANKLATIEQGSVYTRYADDMVISFNIKKNLHRIKQAVDSIVTGEGFKLNPQKERLQNASNGRRIITGIGVDEIGIYPTRKTKKKIRAAIHQMNEQSANGLYEWSLCKFPAKVKGLEYYWFFESV